MFNSLIHEPLYNALIFLIGVVPGYDVGIAVILLTIFVKIALFPLAQNVARMQVIMKKIQPELEEIKEQNKEDKQVQTMKTLELYKENEINPFSGILVMIIQLPIMFGLYWVFYKGGLPNVNVEELYSFVNKNVIPNMMFIGSIDVAGKSIIIAILAGVTQFINMAIIMPKKKEEPKENKKKSIKDEMAKSMQMQMKYLLPFVIGFVSYTISAAIGLYILTSNIFTIGQELLVRKQLAKEEQF